jgi:hypothetical protein
MQCQQLYHLGNLLSASQSTSRATIVTCQARLKKSKNCDLDENLGQATTRDKEGPRRFSRSAFPPSKVRNCSLEVPVEIQALVDSTLKALYRSLKQLPDSRVHLLDGMIRVEEQMLLRIVT